MNPFLFIYVLPEARLPHLCTIYPAFLLPSCLTGWIPAGWLAPFSLCLPALSTPLLPSYWLFSFLLDQLGALGRQGKTAAHLYIVKQMQHIFTYLNRYSTSPQKGAERVKTLSVQICAQRARLKIS